jgi:radical SAM protein with 4Fe4S-binding SPASM domain
MDLGETGILEKVVRRAARERLPVGGAFDLTYRCNYRCLHCYAGHLTAQPRSGAAELATEQVVGLLHAAADAGCLLLLLSGGEPLLREDFVDIYVAARRLGLVVTVFTNAGLVADDHLDVFEEYPPHLVEVSIYGASEATYERITGVAGSFRRTHLGIERLLERGVRVGLKTMILRDNVDEVAAMGEFADSLDVRFRVDPLVAPRLNGDLGPLAHRVDAEVAVGIELASDRRRGKLAEFLEEYGPVVDGESEGSKSRLFRCGAGLSSFHVDPQGVMRPCLMGTAYGFSTAVSGFDGAWAAVKAAVDAAVWEGTGGCRDCGDVLLCGYCPGLFALEQATPSEPPRYVCSLGRNRRRMIEQDRVEVASVAAC